MCNTKYTVTVVNIRNTQGVFFKVDRSTELGNKFYMSDESKRDEVCDKYEKWFVENKMWNSEYFLLLKKELVNKGNIQLGCWCAPKRCHGETIKKYLLEAINTTYTK